MTWKQTMIHETRINGVLRSAYDKHGWTPIDDQTAAEILMAQEPEWDMQEEAPAEGYHYPSEEQPDLELTALKMQEALQVADWARRQQVAWIAGDGLHPFRIVQRFFALIFACHKEVCGPFNGEMFAKMLGQGRAAFQATMDALFSGESRRTYGHVVKVAGQKNAASSAAYAANAAKHKPKQQLNGQADKEQEEALAEELRLRREEREAEVDAKWREYERRRLAREIGCEPEEIDLDKIKIKD